MKKYAILLGALLAQGSGAAFGQGMMWGPGYRGWGHWGYWGGWLGPLIMVVFWALIVVGVVFLVRYLVRQGRGAGGAGREDSALEILKRRYARGEIDKDEFEAKRRDLT
jgi:putative membrane protein